MRLAVVTLTVGMVLNISVLASGQSLTERGTHPFEIEFPQSVDIGMLQIGYFSTGSFGGYGEYVFEKSGEHRILLHTVVKGITATSLKAIVYVPGCQIVTIDVSGLARSRHEFSFQCTSLPTLTLRGKIVPAGAITEPSAIVDVQYVASWSFRFFGIEDGSPAMFRIATVPLQTGSTFRAELPDFSKDPVCNADRASQPDTGFSFTARNSKTWNILGRLAPPNARWSFDNLPIQSDYPEEVVFTLHKR